MERRGHRHGDGQDHFQDGHLPLHVLRGRGKPKDKTEDHFIKMGCAVEGKRDHGLARGRGSPAETDTILLGVCRGRRHFSRSPSPDKSREEVLPGVGEAGCLFETSGIAPGSRKSEQGLHADGWLLDRGRQHFAGGDCGGPCAADASDEGAAAPGSGRGRARGPCWPWRGDAPDGAPRTPAAIGVTSGTPRQCSRLMHPSNRAPSEMWMRWQGSNQSEPDPTADTQVASRAAGLGAGAALAARRGSSHRYDARKPQDGRITWWSIHDTGQ